MIDALHDEGPSYREDPLVCLQRSIDKIELILERQNEDLDDIRQRLLPIEKSSAMWAGAGKFIVWLSIASGIVLAGFRILSS